MSDKPLGSTETISTPTGPKPATVYGPARVVHEGGESTTYWPQG